jgi:predicted SAM-dependent methyltransferase
MKCLNLGCGADKKEDYINVDKDVHDLNKFPYLWQDNEFDEIIAHNIIEHLDNTVKVMEELWRILKQGGRLEIIVPHYLSGTAWGNPEHKRAFTKNTFMYFVKGYSGKETYTDKLFSAGEARVIYSKLFLPMGIRTELIK